MISFTKMDEKHENLVLTLRLGRKTRRKKVAHNTSQEKIDTLSRKHGLARNNHKGKWS